MDIESFVEELKREEEKIGISQRFVIDKHREIIPRLLYECYKSEVRRRGKEPKGMMDRDFLEQIKFVSSWLIGEEKEKWGMALVGECGIGKSTIAKAVKNVIDKLYPPPKGDEWRKTAMWVSAMDLINKAKAEDKSEFMYVKQVENLFIDDVGCEPPSIKVWGNEESPVTELIYYRYDYNKVTYISSNLTQAQLAKRYGVRVGSRLNEMFQFFNIEGDDFR